MPPGHDRRQSRGIAAAADDLAGLLPAAGQLRCLLAGADHGPDGSFPEMGTWLGVNEAGLAVAVTNRHDGELAWAGAGTLAGLAGGRRCSASISPSRPPRFAGAELPRGGYRRLQLPDRRARRRRSSSRRRVPRGISVRSSSPELTP